MESKINALTCPQCGSVNVKVTEIDGGYCENCGTKFKIDTEKPPINIVNNVTVVQDSTQANTSTIKYGTIDKVMAVDDFLRKTFYGFAVSKKAGASIFDSEFMPVEKSYDKFTVAEGCAEIDYSASIGYYRNVKVKKYNNISKKYETEIKRETDWSPHSGKHNGNYVVGLENGKDCGSRSVDILKEISNSEPVLIQNAKDGNCQPYEVTQEEQKNIKIALIDRCAGEAKRSLPGNTHRDFKYSGKSKIEKITAYSLPRYTLKYKYEDKEYSYSEKAYGESKQNISVPQSTEKKNFQNQFWKKYSPVYIVAAILFFVGILLGEVMPESNALSTTFTSIALLVFAGFIVFLSISTSKFIKENQEKKKEKFVEILRKYKLSDATEEELFAIEKASAKSIKDK